MEVLDRIDSFDKISKIELYRKNIDGSEEWQCLSENSKEELLRLAKIGSEFEKMFTGEGVHTLFGIKDLIKQQAEQIERMRWIPVGERLPEDMRRLWAYDGKYIYVARYDLDKKVFYNIEGSFTNDRFYHKILSGITHWMSVPDSPSSRPEGQDYGISK